MALPTLEKTWLFDVNNSQVSGTSLGNSQECLFTIVSAMLTLGSNPWTVVSSSDSVTADNSDNWNTATDLIWDDSGNAHSWIVLKQTALSSTFQMCFDLNEDSGSGVHMSIIISPVDGFTGGTTTDRPTATDELIRTDKDEWGRGNGSGETNTPVHIMISSDGEATRVIFTKSGNISGYWDIQKLKNPSTNWTTPWLLTFSAPDLSLACSYTNLRDAAVGTRTEVMLIVPKPTERIIYCRYCSEGYKGDSYGTHITVANEISGEWEMMPVGVFCSYSPNKGRHGDIYDVWFVSTGLGQADTMPSGGTKEFVVFDDLAFPWDGSVPVTS